MSKEKTSPETVAPVAPVKATRAKTSVSRPDCAAQVIRSLDKPTGLSEIVQRASEAYAAAGGKANQVAMVDEVKSAIAAAKTFGLVTVTRAEVIVHPVKK